MTVTTTTLNDIITPAGVERLRLKAHLPPKVGMQIAWIEAVDGRTKGSSVTIPRADSISVPAGTKTENAQFTLTSVSTSGVSCTQGVVGYRSLVSRESIMFTAEDTLAMLVARGADAIHNRIDVDLMTAASGATNSTDLGAVAVTEANVDDFMSAYNSQVPNGRMHALVLHPAQIADLRASIRSGGGDWLSGPQESERVANLFNVGLGYKGQRHNFHIFESSNVVTAAGEASGFGCVMGPEGALAFRSWNPIDFKLQEQPTYLAWDFVVFAQYGVAVTDQSNIRLLISASA